MQRLKSILFWVMALFAIVYLAGVDELIDPRIEDTPTVEARGTKESPGSSDQGFSFVVSERE